MGGLGGDYEGEDAHGGSDENEMSMVDESGNTVRSGNSNPFSNNNFNFSPT